MKTKNKKELEKHWAEQARKASKLQARKSPPTKTAREDGNQTSAPIVTETTDDK